MLQSPYPMAAPLDIPIGLPEQRRISVAEYHRMVEVGILGEDDRVELLEGVLIAMPPMGEPHSFTIQELNRIIVRALPDGYRVRPQLPVTLGNYSEPQPDLAIVTLEDANRRTEHPENALLVIEVAYSSLRYDRNAKGPVYARWGIPEYWIVDVEGRAVEVYTDPDRAAPRYRHMARLGETDVLQAGLVPIPGIRVAEILP
jgi:Uma2 family endonuclease